jgi:uncharacterized protein (TIGR02996 family)
MSSLRDALEAALVEDPDDLATHRAYADYLQEQGDPRGEFIQVQLALEDPERTPEERQELERREKELLAEYGREWLGILAEELLGPGGKGGDENWYYEIRFVRGWLDRIVHHTALRSDNLGKLLFQTPESRLLSKLVLHFIDLAGVRAIVQSPYLHNLTHLQVRCSNLGDVGCTEIVTSGILKRLKILDLRIGEITDAGARIFADCLDLHRLEFLDIENNGLTQAGIDALRRILGDKLRADDQFTAEELAQRHYLDGVDF